MILRALRQVSGNGPGPSVWFRFVTLPLGILLALLVAGLLTAGLVIALAYPNLPSLQALTEYQPKIPLRIYTAEGVLIGEFGEERRAVVAIGEVPEVLKNAIIAAEDERFYRSEERRVGKECRSRWSTYD